ncbi:MAG TPA: alpha-L-fucosidase [Saprospiraceae bacterium]|nr:alpha-L-fucosidase [Saprospiraceae bacterium]HMQ82467.1 alpha-L-fucosidase [Saprospiraceae bacterium]
MKNYCLFLLACCMIPLLGTSQAIHEEERYVMETDPLVWQKLEAWQDLKFGLLMHWGAYSQWGIVESWSLCPEDYGWCERKKGQNPQNYFAYKAEYEALPTTFNPTQFEPEKWADAAKAAGMRYVVFTTKHHDGFCMFNTQYTDYKITGSQSPFRQHPQADVTRAIFDAFRAQGLWTGAYFSKPDWHSEYYWDPYFPPLDRNVNYDPKLYPEKWENFVQFTHNQLLELASNYGSLDILWLDGGWVQKRSTENIMQGYEEKFQEAGTTGFIKHRMVDQDIRMDEIVAKLRQKQPGLIVVDRAVYGKNQNYLTPENRVPEQSLPYPWESCIISGGGWAHTPDAQYMSGREGIHLLVDIVAKGGNLLLNIAPTPEGTWQAGAYELLKAYADWMQVNGSAIYNSRAIAPFKAGKIAMVQHQDGSMAFFYLADEGENTLPAEIRIPAFQPSSNAQVSLLGTSESLKWEKDGEGFRVKIPKKWQSNPPCRYAWTIKVSEVLK